MSIASFLLARKRLVKLIVLILRYFQRKQLESIQQIDPDAVTIIEHEDLLKCPRLGMASKSNLVTSDWCYSSARIFDPIKKA